MWLAQYDAVATCFFIDTAVNIIEYIEIIYDILRPGGIWVNCGPLQYISNVEAYNNYLP